MEKRFIGLITLLTWGWFIYSTASRSYQVALAALAAFQVVAAKGCDKLVEDFYNEKLVEDNNNRKNGMCAASIGLTLVTGAVRSGLTLGAFNPFSKRDDSLVEYDIVNNNRVAVHNSLANGTVVNPHTLDFMWETMMNHIGEDGYNYKREVQDNDIKVRPLSIVNTSSSSGPAYTVMFAKRHEQLNNTYYVAAHLNNESHTSFVTGLQADTLTKRDGSVSWGDITYLSYRIDWEDRNAMLHDDGTLPSNSDFINENCPYAYDNEVTTEMDLSLCDAQSGQGFSDHPVVGGRLGLMHDPSYEQWQADQFGEGDVHYMADGSCGSH